MAKIVATVADSLIAVGALSVTSTLLREFPSSGPDWHVQLAYRWGHRAHQETARFRAAEHRRLVVRLPLEHATAVIENVSAQGELVSVQLYGHPWVTGEYWPMITPCFQIRAIDDAGNSEYGALKEFTRLMNAADTPGLELPGMVIPGIAASYGVQSEQVKEFSDLARAVGEGTADIQRMIIGRRILDDSRI